MDYNRPLSKLNLYRKQTAKNEAYSGAGLPSDIDTIGEFLDYALKILIPNAKPAVATENDLPTVGNDLYDYRIVMDYNNTGNEAGFRWYTIEGESTPSWHLVNMRASTDSILQQWEQNASALYVNQIGIPGGQMIAGGTNANDNLVLTANTGDGSNLPEDQTGHIRLFGDTKPSHDDVFDLGTALERFKSLYVSGNISDGTAMVTVAEMMIAYAHSQVVIGNPHQIDYDELVTKIGNLTVSGGVSPVVLDLSTSGNKALVLNITDDSHNHTVSTITDFDQGVYDKLKTTLIDSSTVSYLFDDINQEITATVTFSTAAITDISSPSANKILAGSAAGTEWEQSDGSINLFGDISGSANYNSTNGWQVSTSVQNTPLESVDRLKINNRQFTSTLGATTNLNIVNHKMTNGSQVRVFGTSFDGVHTITVVDSDNLTINAATASNESGYFISENDQFLYNPALDLFELKREFEGISHHEIANLNADDHTQYAKLDGRSTEQVLSGGELINGRLILQSTSDRSNPGVILLRDSIEPESGANYTAGWQGTDIGSNTRAFRDVHIRGSVYGLKSEEVSSLPIVQATEKGRKVRLPNGDEWINKGTAYRKFFTEPSFTGQANKILSVKSDESGFELITNGGLDIPSLSEKTSPASSDLLLIADSEDSNNYKKVNLGNITGGLNNQSSGINHFGVDGDADNGSGSWSSDTDFIISVNTVNPLRGSSDYRIDYTGPGSTQTINSYTFNIDSADIGKEMEISFDFQGLNSNNYFDNEIFLGLTPGDAITNASVVSGKFKKVAYFTANNPSYTLSFNCFGNGGISYHVNIDNIIIKPREVQEVSSEINYAGQSSSAENNQLGDWISLDGTTGISVNNTNPLRGSYDYLVQDSTSATAGDKKTLAALPFSVDLPDRNKIIYVSLDADYKGFATNTFLRINIYDEDNSQYVSIERNKDIKKDGSHIMSFQATGSTNYRLELQRVTTSVSSANFKYQIDNIVIAPENFISTGAYITDWEEYTPSFAGFGTPTNTQIYYRRVGDTLELEGRFTAGTTSGSIIGTVGLPSGLKLDFNKISNNNNHVGTYVRNVTAASKGGVIIVTPSEDNAIGFSASGTFNSSSTNPLSRAVGSSITATGQAISISAKFPIDGWSGSTKISTILNQAPIDVYAEGNSGQTITANSPIVWDGDIQTGGIYFDGSKLTNKTGETKVLAVKAVVYTNSDVEISIRRRVNSVATNRVFDQNGPTTSLVNNEHHFSDMVKLKPDDELEYIVTGITSMTLSSGDFTRHWIRFNSFESGASLLAPPVVSLIAESDSGQAIGTSETLITYEDIDSEFNLSYDIANGKIKCNFSGVYRFNVSFLSNSVSLSTSQGIALHIYVNGTKKRTGRLSGVGSSSFFQPKIDTTLLLNEGDEVEIYANASVATSMNTQKVYNYLCVTLQK
ncbi:MAG: hypothetical protein N4A33_04815 [Bacteriovoracaceae bacterium]|jgi:hypothetical protein|nr:hypothetical protein [Bacteriovoracaceae bacterium]